MHMKLNDDIFARCLVMMKNVVQIEAVFNISKFSKWPLF